MRLPIILIIILMIVNAVIDVHTVFTIKQRVRNPRIWLMAHLAITLLSTCALIAAIVMPIRSGTNNQLLVTMWILYSYMSIFIPKIIWIIFDLISKIPKRKRSNTIWISNTGAILGIIVFFTMWWGALVNRYNINIKTVDIDIPGLPEAFNGYKIVQFSDLHVGTFASDTSFVSRIVDTINNLHPDMIAFTGDIVNRNTEELFPFVRTLSRLKANDGVYSILGNHDYGDYFHWQSPEDKKRNMQLLKQLQHDMGWKLLLNKTAIIHHGNDSIALIGVENIGDPPFRVYGSLNTAYPETNDNTTKILLTHNPAHWVDSISGHENVNIDLTLSGHTHAMQITVGQFSPACFRYKTWGGLYNDETEQHKLYVNIGAGAVGMPMRIGATPEITVLTLKNINRKS